MVYTGGMSYPLMAMEESTFIITACPWQGQAAGSICQLRV
jgi:hypothetical protein